MRERDRQTDREGEKVSERGKERAIVYSVAVNVVRVRDIE